MLRDLGRDLRYALRILLKSPLFTAVAVFSLALGIGANSVVFSVFNSLLFQPLPVERPEELASVFTSDRSSPWGTTSYADLVDLREGVGAFQELIGYTLTRFHLETGQTAVPILGERVTGNYFTGLGAKPILGRTFTSADDVPGGPWVAVISERLWRRHLEADPAISGKTLRINGQTFTVLGVVPEGFRDTLAGLSVDVWVPLVASARPLAGGDAGLRQRGHRDLLVLGRLRSGARLAEAEAQMKSVANRLQTESPATNQERSFQALPASEAGVHPRVREILSTLGIALSVVVGVVLVIASLNLANLLLARAVGRQREVAIRLSIGATRRRLVRQLLAESLLLSLLGGAAGLLLAAWAIRLLRHFRPPEQVPIALDVGINPSTLLVTLALSLLTALLFGLVPALQATRPDLSAALKSETALSRSGKRRRMTLRNSLVVAQVTVSLVLLIGAALFLRSLARVEGIDPGFDTRNVLVLPIDLETVGGYDEVRGQTFYRSLVERVRSLPGVRSVAVSETLPLGFERSEAGIQVPDQPGTTETVTYNVITPDYFRTLGIQLLSGRDFVATDSAEAPQVVIVNETLARRYWPSQDATGKLLFDGTSNLRIVGVVKDIKYRFLGEAPMPYLYVPLAQSYEEQVNLQIKTAGDPLQLAGPLRQVVESLEPQLQGLSANTLEGQVAFALLPGRVGGVIFIVFGLLTLSLACMGIYGVMAFSVRQRTREMAIRMSLGAEPGDVLRLVLRESMSLVAVGAVIGLLIALPIMRFVGDFLYGVSPADPVSLIGVIAVLGGAALLASYVPARRATRVDPMKAMRYD